MDLTRTDRIRGALMGLLAGDKIGGPSRMALELADSLIECGRFDAADVVRRYKVWFDREGFDTGQIAGMVLCRMNTMSNDSAVIDVDDYVGGLTAGCNPAHRVLPLALLSSVEDGALMETANSEARLTHRHTMAGAVSGVYLSIVRALLAGSTSDVMDIAIDKSRNEFKHYLIGGEGGALSPGGYAPEVLCAALYFTSKAESFDEALDSSIRFAGPANFCPVLVGAMAGARFGFQAIKYPHISHCSYDHLSRAKKLGDQMASTWNRLQETE